MKADQLALFQPGSAGKERVIKPIARPVEASYPRVLGNTFDESLDGARLRTQYDRVRDLMIDGRWRTLSEISLDTDQPEASISARLRDLRRAKWNVERRRRGGGLWEYSVSGPARA
jgi:hypothetical protein